MYLEPVIGLEIHVKLKTKSKMFCSCDNRGENEPPNTTICPICLGHPGVLPVINRKAVEYAVLASLALNCKVLHETKFDRKNYFYPDLPKGFQISQFDMPIGTNGFLEIFIPSKSERETAKIGIARIHLEEDAAKLIHTTDGSASLVDFNRAGTPLLEIVTLPDIRSPLEARIFLQELRLIMRYLDISDADMEKGQLRCDANISLRKAVQELKDESLTPQLNPKTELKNMNSFKAVERALNYEIKRQTKLWEEGKPPMSQSTRGWNEEKGVTEELRLKEESHDYRYFREPDLPPLNLHEIEERNALKIPELPQERRNRFADEYGLSKEDARSLTDDVDLANYTEQVISELRSWLISLPDVHGTEEEIWEANKKKLSKLVSGWLLSKLGGLMAESKISWKTLKITPENFAEFITLLHRNLLSSTAGQKVLQIMLQEGKDPSHIMEEQDLSQRTDIEEVEPIIKRVLAHHPGQIAEYKAGKVQVLKFLLGVVMKETDGRINPKIAEELLKKNLE